MKKILLILILLNFQNALSAQSFQNQVTDSLDQQYASVIKYLFDSSRSIASNIVEYNHINKKKEKEILEKRLQIQSSYIIYDTICNKRIMMKQPQKIEDIRLPFKYLNPKDSSLIEYYIQSQNNCTAMKGLNKTSASTTSFYQIEFSPILNDCLIVELFSGSSFNILHQCCKETKFGEGYFLLVVFNTNSSSIKEVFYGSGIIYN